jgi:hypothetical protein
MAHADLKADVVEAATNLAIAAAEATGVPDFGTIVTLRNLSALARAA